MKNKTLYALWGLAYILCALLGFVPSPTGLLKGLLVFLSLLFFLPGAILLYKAIRQKDKKTLRVIRIISGASLLLTLLVLVANFLAVLASETLGNVLYVILVLVSVPMVSSQFWVVSMFLWACLLIGSFMKSKK